jgi:hypothetical protein
VHSGGAIPAQPKLDPHSLNLAAKTKRQPNQNWLTTIQIEKEVIE